MKYWSSIVPSDQNRDLLALVKILVGIKVHARGVEALFSTLAWLKPKNRNRMKKSTLTALGRLNMRLRLRKKKPVAFKKRSASDYGDATEVQNMEVLDDIAGGVFDEEEFYDGVDAMMPEGGTEALEARQGAAMEEWFDFDMYDRMTEGEQVESAPVHSMASSAGGENAEWDIDDLFKYPFNALSPLWRRAEIKRLK
jgi:hypothetical protein